MKKLKIFIITLTPLAKQTTHKHTFLPDGSSFETRGYLVLLRIVFATASLRQ
jgi:hypothetical protein